MGPARGWADEVLQEQRGDDRPGIGAARDVVEVGDLAVETLAVGLVQGQAPYRVALRSAVAQDEPRPLVVIAEKRRPFRPERDARGAGQGGEVEQLGTAARGER